MTSRTREDHGVEVKLTVHGKAMSVVPSCVLADEVLEVESWIFNRPNFIYAVDEIPAQLCSVEISSDESVRLYLPELLHIRRECWVGWKAGPSTAKHLRL
jgi:hypothetical protein